MAEPKNPSHHTLPSLLNPIHEPNRQCKGKQKTSIIITYRNKSSDTQDWILRTPGALQAWPPQDDLRPLARGHRLPWRWQNAAERHKQMLLVKFRIREATRTPVSNRFVKLYEMMLRDRMQGETKRDCRHSHGSWACVAKARAKSAGRRSSNPRSIFYAGRSPTRFYIVVGQRVVGQRCPHVVSTSRRPTIFWWSVRMWGSWTQTARFFSIESLTYKCKSSKD